jgi:D-serine deaminase-like pyridoxal phosphate-dependent protein
VQTKSDILTPALLLDLDAFEANLARMIAQVNKSGKKLRPHAKAHKCPEIARRQIAAGAVGVCVATLAEAEMMARAGIKGLLLTSPVAQAQKIARIVATGAMVVVDHVQQVELFQQAAKAAGIDVDILVDLDVGDHRTGAASLQQALGIAEAADRASHLRLRGLQAYSVVGSHAAPGEERTRISREVFGLAAEVRDALQRGGFSTEILSGGSTGTWQVDTALPELTELQAGSFVLMDLAYQRAGLDFRHAMTVAATVISANHDAFVTVDAGYKSFSTDRGYGPEAVALPGSQYRWGGDEFGYIDLNGNKLKLGDRVEFIPPHCDPTSNLYDTIYACRGERVEGVWPVKRLG